MKTTFRPCALIASLAVLAFIVVSAIAGLAIEGNWPKIARVVTAFLAYVVVLLAARRGRDADDSRAPIGMFVLAGAASGLVSGLVREAVQGGVLLAGVLGGGLLLGGVHWLALRAWQRLRPLPTP